MEAHCTDTPVVAEYAPSVFFTVVGTRAVAEYAAVRFCTVVGKPVVAECAPSVFKLP